MVDTSTLGFAFAAGLVAALNPCGFAMLPSYLTLVVLGTGERQGRSVVVARALAATVAMAAGFLVVFALFGLIVAPLAGQVQRYLPIVIIVIGAALLGLGGWMLAGREITLLLPKSGKGTPTTALRPMFGYGLDYAIASLSCTIGPFLAVLATAARRSRRACATMPARADSAAVTPGSTATRSNKSAFRSYHAAASSADDDAAGIARSSAPISLSTVPMARDLLASALFSKRNGLRPASCAELSAPGQFPCPEKTVVWQTVDRCEWRSRVFSTSAVPTIRRL
jgi:cytochrome c biogenesis protein CcdA